MRAMANQFRDEVFRAELADPYRSPQQPQEPRPAKRYLRHFLRAMLAMFLGLLLAGGAFGIGEPVVALVLVGCCAIGFVLEVFVLMFGLLAD